MHEVTRMGVQAAAPVAAAGRVSAAASARTRPSKLTGGLLFLYVCWFIILCDPQWLLATYVGGAILKVPTGLFAILLVITLAKGPRDWYKQLLFFLLYTAIMLPLAYNPFYALTPTKQVFLYFILTVGTLTYVRTAKQAIPFVVLYFLVQNLWWDANGSAMGRVPWHPTNTNFDNFGPQMVICMAGTYYFAMATKTRWLKWLALAAMVGGVVGVVATFARGAALSGAAVLAWIWFRSPRKGITTVIVAGAVAVVLIVGGLVYTAERRGGKAEGAPALTSFFSEMATIGVDDSTMDDREVLWSLSVRVFKAHPFFGVGAENFGPWSAENFEVGTTGGFYDANPGRLYDKKIHSTYFQMLCEYGVVGGLIFVGLFVDFFRRNRRLRSPDFVRTWAAATDGALDLGRLALGLEACMVGFLATGVFYNQIFLPWLWAIFAMNRLLYGLARPAGAPARNGVRTRAA